MTPPRSPRSVYDEKIKRGELRKDPHQSDAVDMLETLYRQLTAQRTPAPRWRKFIRKWRGPAKNQPIRGYYIWGGVGAGKTILMDMFHQSLPAGLGHRIHFHRFMKSVHDKKNTIKGKSDPLDIIAKSLSSKYAVLCLDEFAVTDITDAMILSEFLRHLFKRGAILVTTSNSRPEDLYKDGLQRDRFSAAIALIREHTLSISVDGGTDYRMAYLRDNDIFHVPAGGRADSKLRRCFDGLTATRNRGKKSVSINDRDVGVLAEESGVIWFEFAELCQSSRSKLDYIEIARQYHTVLISNIPLLTSVLDDAARRFIELIDELYDRNVNLIASSHRLPAQMYSGTRLAGPFRRTASRLTEMSTDDYLSRPHLS